MPSLGEAYIEVHADTGPFDRELAASIEAALIKAEAAMRSRGRDAGNAFSQGVETAVKDRTKHIGENLSDDLVHAAENAGKDVKNALEDVLSLAPNINDSGLDKSRNRFAQWANDIGQSVSQGLSSASSAISGFANELSQIFQGGGSILFNPGVLLTLFGYLGGAILGLTQLLTPLGALFLALPAALSAVGVEVFVLMAAFDGLGKAIKGAFLAKNATDLEAALKGLTGSTRSFVADFYEVGKVWRDIVKVAQDNFFRPLTGVIDNLIKNLRGPLLSGVAKLADSLGFSIGLIGTVLAGPAMQKLIKDLFPALAKIVDKLSGPFVELLGSLLGLIDNSLPFLSDLADILGSVFKQVADWLNQIGKDGSLKKFFGDAVVTIKIVLIVLGQVWDFIKSILAAVQQGNGNNFLLALGAAFEGLAKFFASDFGKKAVADMITSAEGAIVVVSGLIIVIFSLYEAMILAFQAIGAFFSWLWNDILVPIGNAIGTFFSKLFTAVNQGWIDIATAGQQAWQTLQTAFYNAVGYINTKWQNLQDGIRTTWANVIVFFQSIPTRIRNAIGDLGSLLVNAGRSMINGLISGIESAIPGLKSTLNWVTDHLPSWKGPEEKDAKILQPAGMAVMDGFRKGLAAGAADVFSDLRAITGMIGVNANANSFNFGPGAITQNFNGAQPTAIQAQSLGAAVGAGIAGTVNNQNMRAGTRAV